MPALNVCADPRVVGNPDQVHSQSTLREKAQGTHPQILQSTYGIRKVDDDVEYFPGSAQMEIRVWHDLVRSQTSRKSQRVLFM
jgi:hypothetical protein